MDASSTPPKAGSAAPSDPLLVHTRSGPVAGVATPAARVFRGIPYAAPPVGPLRFAAPRPPEPWTTPPPGVPTTCPQLGTPAGLTSEDCLTLDVWTPLSVPSEPLPVMVWIHGGSFTAGSGFLADAGLPTRGVIVVAINYRLGALGFLGHPALSAEGGGSSGNYAIEDQRLALEWVRDNAAAFGGDPQRVTIFGESAGGSAICAHLWSPRSTGLFQRAILQSGALCGRASRTLAQAEEQGERLAAVVGCSGAGEAVLACLRDKPADALLAALAQRSLLDDGAYWGPVVDGTNFDRPLPEALMSGAFNRVPTLIGSNANEGLAFLFGLETLSAEDYAARVHASPFFGEHAEALLALYPAADYPTPQLALAALVGHRVFNCPARRTARAIAATGTPVYEYLFAYGAALHAEELGYLFTSVPSPGEPRIADALKDYWARFAATGDPNGEGDPRWPRYEAAGDLQLVFGAAIAEESALFMRECDGWDQFEG